MKQSKKESINLGHGARMLCPVCNTLQVAEHVNERNEVYLACRHPRTSALLPTTGISLEDALENNGDAKRLFPPRENGVSDDLSLVMQREGWK